ncbi:hypothetical protein ABW21_db0203680 [Orbilia brochopaga]|nr:hypothetical protein ABW21_db0203680 [Drechslerella brochopaga]
MVYPCYYYPSFRDIVFQRVQPFCLLGPALALLYPVRSSFSERPKAQAPRDSASSRIDETQVHRYSNRQSLPPPCQTVSLRLYWFVPTLHTSIAPLTQSQRTRKEK